MTLQLQTGYTDKTGQFVEFKTPKVKLIGKDMSQGETHQFTVLVDGVKAWPPKTPGGYPTYTMFVKSPSFNGGNAITLELSKQAMQEITTLEPSKWDVMTVTLEYEKNEQTGALQPKVKASINKNQKPITQDRVENHIKQPQPVQQQPPQQKVPQQQTTIPQAKEPAGKGSPEAVGFARLYREVWAKKSKPGEEMNVNHFVGTYYINYEGEQCKWLEDLFEQEVQR